LFGATKEQAVACAIVLHAVSFVPVTLLGLIIMAKAGLTIQRAREESALIKKEEDGRQKAEGQASEKEEVEG
jgi:hypothetical protein